MEEHIENLKIILDFLDGDSELFESLEQTIKTLEDGVEVIIQVDGGIASVHTGHDLISIEIRDYDVEGRDDQEELEIVDILPPLK